jgi:hypothetical protein
VRQLLEAARLFREAADATFWRGGEFEAAIRKLAEACDLMAAGAKPNGGNPNPRFDPAAHSAAVKRGLRKRRAAKQASAS